MGLVNRVVAKNRRVMGVSIHSLVRRIPMAAGPVLGGAMIGLYASGGLSEEAARIAGIRTAFTVALALGLLAMAAVYFFMPADAPEESAPRGLRQLYRQMDQSLKNLLLSDILIRFAEQIPYAFVVIWVVKYNLVSEFHFGLLTAIEMGTALLVYIPVAFLADRHGGKKPFVLMTFFFFTAFPLVLLFSRSFGMLVAAFIIRGLKEFGEPTRKALIMELSPEDCKAASFGAYYLIRDVAVGFAALSSSFLWDLSPAVNFSVAALCGGIGTVLYALFGRDVTQGPPHIPCMPGTTNPLPAPSQADHIPGSPR
jgi:MFS family permease